MIPERRPGNLHKLYVQALIHACFDGKVIPKYIGFENGDRVKIDKVIMSKRAAARKAGGQGILYIVLGTPEQQADTQEPPQQRQFSLFYDDPYWFVEVDDERDL